MRVNRSMILCFAILALAIFLSAPATALACNNKSADNTEVIKANAGGAGCAKTCTDAEKAACAAKKSDETAVIKANAGGSDCAAHKTDDTKVTKANAGGSDCAAHGATAKNADAKGSSCTVDKAACAAACAAKGASASGCADKSASVQTAQALPEGHVVFGVAYMSCDGCATKVADAIKKVDGVRSVGVCFKSGVADVDFDNAKCSEKQIMDAISNAGYHTQVGAYTAEELAAFAKGETSAEVKKADATK